MNFRQSVSICFKKYFDFKGRASKSEFWYFFLFFIIGNLFILFFNEYMERNSDLYYSIPDTLYNILYYTGIGSAYLFLGTTIIPTLTAAARRLHDVSLSGFVIVPFSFIFLFSAYYEFQIALRIIPLVFCLLLWQRSKGENKFGSVPKK